MGQAAGTAAAYSNDLSMFQNQDIAILQQRLIRDGCYLELE
jgi:hypothetical protein